MSAAAAKESEEWSDDPNVEQAPRYVHMRWDEIVDEQGKLLFEHNHRYSINDVRNLGYCTFLDTQSGVCAFRCAQSLDGPRRPMCPGHMAHVQKKRRERQEQWQQHQTEQKDRKFKSRVEHYKKNMTIAPGASVEMIDRAARAFAKMDLEK